MWKLFCVLFVSLVAHGSANGVVPLLRQYRADFGKLEESLAEEIQDPGKEGMSDVTLLRQFEKFGDRLEQVQQRNTSIDLTLRDQESCLPGV